MTIHYLPYCNLSQTHYVTLKKPPFFHHFNFKSLRKRYGLSLSHYIFHVLSFIFLNLLVGVMICDICSFGYGLGSCLLCLGVLVLVDLVSRMLNMVVIMF